MAVAEQEQETETQVQEVTELTDAQEAVVFQCDALKEHLKQASVLYYELELVGQAKQLRAEHDKMDERKARLVKRVGRSGSREEREANKAAKKAERIAKLREQLAKLTTEE